MRLIKLSLVLLLVVGLAACGQFKKRAALVNSAQTLAPLRTPAGTHGIGNSTYYKVPSNHIGGVAVPITPPGSNLQRFKISAKQIEHTDIPKPASHLTQNNEATELTKHVAHQETASQSLGRKVSLSRNAQYLLITHANANQVWGEIGRALSFTDYKILDKDNMAKTYYILDVTKTNNAITDNTPIYILDVQQKGSNTEVEITDQYNGSVSAKISNRILSSIRKGLV